MLAKIVLVNAITLLGFAGALFGIFTGNPYWVLAAAPLDAVDGYLARKLGAVTEGGAALDLSCDFVVAVLCAFYVSPYWVAAVPLCHVAGELEGFRSSGRFPLSVLFVVSVW